MSNKTQTISKTTAAKKAAPKAAPKSASRIISTNDAAQAKQVAAGLPATNALASAAAYKARKGSEASKASKGSSPSSTAGIVAMIVEGIAKRIEAKSPFYATALAYHARNKTAFPRARNNETRAALKVEDVTTVFDQHDKKILAAGNARGQAMFDVYMMSRT